MKKDPNKCCVIFDESKLWALIHDLVAHPFLAISGYSKVGERFHDYTSSKAWTRE